MKHSASRKVRKPKAPKSQVGTLLRAVVDSIPMGVLVWGVDGTLQFANRRAAEIAGRPFQPGQTPAEIVATHHIQRSGTREPYPAELFSSLRVLRMSGYAAEEIVAPANPESGLPFLRKPFSIDELATAVEAVLDSEGS